MERTIFVSQAIADKNSEIMNAYFTLNKKLDNLMDFVDIAYVMPHFSTLLHHIAHKAPIDADRFRDYNALYSLRTKYTAIDGQYVDFADVGDGVSHILDYLADMDNMLAEGKLLAQKEQNYDYEKFIDNEFVLLREYKGMFIKFIDLLVQYKREGNTLQDFDRMISIRYFNGDELK